MKKKDRNIVELPVLFEIRVNEYQTLFSMYFPGHMNLKENRYMIPENIRLVYNLEEFLLKNDSKIEARYLLKRTVEKDAESTLVLAGEKVFLEITERYFEFDSNSDFVVGVLNQVSNLEELKVKILRIMKNYRDTFFDSDWKSPESEYLGFLNPVFLKEIIISCEVWILLNDQFKGYFDMQRGDDEENENEEEE